MFVALEWNEPESKGILAGMRNILTRPKLILKPRRALGASYMLLQATGNNGPDWDKIAAVCGRYAGRLLLPAGVDAPVSYVHPVFPRFEQAVLLATACELIQRTNCPMYRRVIGLVDPDGRNVDMLCELLKYYTCVKVFTSFPERYMEETERMMREFGAPVLFCAELSSLQDCVLILAPTVIPCSRPVKLLAPVLSAVDPPQALRCADLLTVPRVTPSPELLGELPDGIDPHEFSGALYEYCGVREICLIADEMLYNYRRSTLTEVCHMIESYIRLRNW